MSISAAETIEQKIYDEVVSHYRNCLVNKRLLSDTWDHTLKQKGRVFSLPTMRSMLALGNRVNTWIDEFPFLVDATCVDADDAVARALIAQGESDFGEPRRDLCFEGRWYSSNLVHHAVYASRVVRAVKERGIERPVILEIGGGLGGVAHLLRRYFGDKLTYFVVDLPETLLIQEWYLRSSYPEAPTSFRSGSEPVAPVTGGFNFVNAYKLGDQNYAFDTAINIDSMQEMNSEAIAFYVEYIQRNLAPNGLFFFQNHYGQASSPVREPSEYPLDGLWRVHSMEITQDIECGSGCDQARIVYHRTDKPENTETRRLVLRALWNGFLSGRVPNDAGLVEELSEFPARLDPAAGAKAVSAAFSERGLDVPDAWVAKLAQDLYFPPRPFVAALADAPRTATDFKQRHMRALWQVQSGALKLMEGAADDGLAGKVASLCANTAAQLEDTSRSEFWSAYFAAIFFSLKQTDLAAKLLNNCAAKSANPFWLTRFAYLWQRFGRDADAAKLLDRLDGLSPRDYFSDLKRAELSTACGRKDRARALLQNAAAGAGDDVVRWVSLTLTAARMDEAELSWKGAIWLLDRSPEAAAGILLSLAGENKALHPRILPLIEKLQPTADDQSVHFAFLLLELGQRDDALERMAELERRFPGDYFRLGQIGKLAQQAGLDDLADRCLNRSLELRPGAFLHQEFVGGIYLAAARFDQAAAHFSKALELKPYLRHLLAKHLHCRLPADVRASGVLGQTGDLRLMYQREQDFYHDLGPSSK